MAKDYKKKRKKFIDKFRKVLPKYKAYLPDIFYPNQKANIESNSWFDITKYKSKKVDNGKYNLNLEFPNESMRCQKVKMILNNKQKLIINKWFDIYTDMYNETLKYIRNQSNIFKNEVIKKKLSNYDKNIIDKYKLRAQLKNVKDNLILQSQIKEINDNTKIQSHTLDYAIRQLVSNIKSAITNTRKGNIKRFRLKFWKYNRPSKTIDIEKQYIKNNKICYNILGDIKYFYNNEECDLKDIDSGVKINYNSITNEYLLLIPIKTKIKEIKKNKNLISLDPGLRTYMTGLSDDEVIKIGTNVNTTIKKYIERLNNIKENEKIPNKIKKKNEIKINGKIYNKIDDMQWKTIKYLTSNYKTILLGDMSAKSIVAKNRSVLDNLTKVSCLRLRYYDFRRRLEYKCIQTKTNYKLVNECYTSKICSLCGNYNEKLQGAKIYDCRECLKKIDRDVNGCRNIMIKSLMV